MKKMMLLPLLFVFTLMAPDILAQTTAKCGVSTTETLSSPVYYPKRRYTYDSDAIRKFKEDMLSGYTCETDTCPRPNLYNCPPEIVSIPDPVSVDGQWCFSGDVDWKCPGCTRIDDSDTESDSEGFSESPDESFDHESKVIDRTSGLDDIVHVESNDALASIRNIYPNPSSGNIYFEIEVKQGGKNKVEIKITDVSGKVLIQDHYSGIRPGSFRPMNDLSQLPKGIYFSTVYVNGKKIGSSKLSLQ